MSIFLGICLSLCGLAQAADTVAGAPPAEAAPPQAVPARATPRDSLYRVELIVFRATAPLGTPEDWSAEAAAAGLVAPAATTAESPEAVRGHVSLLPPADFQLDRVAARLRASGRYVPIGHAVWTQRASPWGRPVEIPLESLGLTAPGLHGTLALERGEFLHLALRLDYAESDPPPGLGAAPGTPFVLDQVHRVRFYDRDYFDHPAFGVIAVVTPAQAPRRPRP